MTGRRVAGTLALTMGLLSVGAAPGHAQDPAGSLGVAAAPRLSFTPDQMALAVAVADDGDLAAFYGGNGLRPIFLGQDGAERRAALRQAVARMPDHGVPAHRYPLPPASAPADGLGAEIAHARQAARLLRDLTGGVLTPARVDPEIKRQPDRGQVPGMLAAFEAAAEPAAILDGAAPDHPSYRLLQAALREQADLTVPAALPRIPEGVWRPGTSGPGVVLLRAGLASIGFTAPVTDADLYDPPLAEAVARYQRAAGLPDDGIAGPRTIARLNGEDAQGLDARQRSIIVALERLRWMDGQDLGGRHVWVNIPEFSTTILQDGVEVFRTRSVMGKDRADMRTPEFSDVMDNVVVNPSWNVPRSITVRDYLPKLQANRHALGHLDVLNGSGRVLSRDGIDFSHYTAANFPFRLRQKPSGDNALGIVKFIFPNPWNIYLHDTPSKHLFGNRVRAESNGCIRIGDPVDLARALLSRQTDDPGAMFARALDSGRETWLTLRPAVPVHLVYFTAWPGPDGRIQLFDDIYARDARIWAGLEAEGFGTGGDVIARAR